MFLEWALGRDLVLTYQVVSRSIQLFGHNTPTLQTDRPDNGSVAYGEPLVVTIRPKITELDNVDNVTISWCDIQRSTLTTRLRGA